MFKTRFILFTALLCLALPAMTMADDTEIYGTTSVSLKPNVMIIMDNSGSMKTKDVPGDPYDPAITYPITSYETNAVYRPKLKKGEPPFVKLPFTLDDITCSGILTKLNTTGHAYSVTIDYVTGTCSDSWGYKKLYLGNFLNYDNTPDTASYDYRFEVAKRAMVKLLETSTDKNYGLMHFNSSEGGYVKYPCAERTDNSELIAYINGMTDANFSTWTPLSETLAEAGLYYAGMKSWFNSGVTHTSPITEVCQKNYIILMTDGEPTQDNNYRLKSTTYMNGKVIHDYDKDGKDFDSSGNFIYINGDYGSHMLDDVAKFLYEEDIRHPMGDGTSFVKQNVITHTIGFKTEVPILSSTAANGGGMYLQANSSSSLDAALEEINNSISESNAVFLAPAVPVNRTLRTSQSDWLYLAFFKPQNTGEWLGNIKKFAIGKKGEIYGKNAAGDIDYTQSVVDDLGQIKDNACSFWTLLCPDGNNVSRGGLGELLTEMDQATRKIYFFTGGTDKDLTSAANKFSLTNGSLSDIADAVITSVLDFTSKWKLGAIIHSEPAIVHYSTTQSYIFVGANDGMLHCFDDTTGAEVWGFIPPGQKDRLSLISDANHDYYVDGSPTVAYKDALIDDTQLLQPHLMIFGERRGGNRYYVIDITKPLAPAWQYEIISDILTSDVEILGQSWAKPKVCTLSTKTTTVAGKKVPDAATLENVFMIAGGYDTNQDLDVPVSPDKMGKAIFSVKTSEGTLSKFLVSDKTVPSMKNCIVDITTAAPYTMSDGTEITTRVYAGDLGGKVFTFADDREIIEVEGVDTVKSKVPDGSFKLKNCLFDTQGKKIFYPPASSKMPNSYTEWVVFGTGDREKPLNTTKVNRIYAVKNNWLKTGLTEADLTDLTENVFGEGSVDDQKKLKTTLEGKDGWYITFYDPGEKMTSSPIITQGYVFFTTYVPSSGTTATDPCAGVGATGVSYLWSIELDTGVPVYDKDSSGVKTKAERRTQVAVMAQPKLIGDMISTPKTMLVPTKISFDYFFWRQR